MQMLLSKIFSAPRLTTDPCYPGHLTRRQVGVRHMGVNMMVHQIGLWNWMKYQLD